MLTVAPGQVAFLNDLPQRHAIGMPGHRQSDLTARATDHIADWRPVIVPTDVAPSLVGPPTWRVGGVVVRHPFFPRILVRLVLLHLVFERYPIAVAVGEVLEPMPEVVQLRAVTLEFAGQLGRRNSLGNPTHDQDQLTGPPLGAVQSGLGEGVEDPPAMATAVIEHRCTVATPEPKAARMVRLTNPLAHPSSRRAV